MENENQTPHKRRVHYKGKYPKKFEEKYKELQPEKYKDTIAHVIQKGNTPAGMHISIMVKEILDFLQIKPGQTGFDATLGYGGHTKAMLEQLQGQGHIHATDVDPAESAKTKKRLADQGFGEDMLTIHLQNFCTIDEIAKEVKKEFGIPEDKRVILYAPTWRDNQFYGKGKYKFTLAMDLERMRKEFGKDSVILLRTHYYIADSLDLTGLEDFVYNGSTYNDVSRLYLASDICITDYSSVFFDYANLRRPMLFFAYDYEDYKDEIRGMYFDMNTELPGPIVQTNDELVDALHHIDEISEKYKKRYDRFYDKFCHVDDGHASKRAIDIVFEGAKPTFAETEE